MKIYKEVFSPIEVNTYILEGDEGGCIVIDCGCYGPAEERRLEKYFKARALTPVLLLNTHCHLDHIFGNAFMLERFGLRSWFHEGDSHNHASATKHAQMFGLDMEEPPMPAGYLSDGEVLTAAGVSLEVIAVPGHSPGGIAFYSEKDGVIFTGDALFAGSIGRSDLPGGDHEQLMTNIRKRLFILPPDTIVYPGHGPETTIREEMKSNPFFV
ncbi:MAG: MBL fold metallo-hydrolase [Bacteroidales bacterium]|nr:MBL fold metallo-hydrolase [Bacteroidales bacterium]